MTEGMRIAEDAAAHIIDARLALINWQKYNGDKANEIVYQAEKMATSLAAITYAMAADKAALEEGWEQDRLLLCEKEAEIERLREAITDLQAQVEQERAKVVEWLRNNAYSFRQPNAGLAMDAAYRAWREAADAIERGDHVS